MMGAMKHLLIGLIVVLSGVVGAQGPDESRTQKPANVSKPPAYDADDQALFDVLIPLSNLASRDCQALDSQKQFLAARQKAFDHLNKKYAAQGYRVDEVSALLVPIPKP